MLLEFILSVAMLASPNDAATADSCSATDRSKEHAIKINALTLDEVTKCAKTDDAVAINELGVRYGTGAGVSLDSIKSYEYYLAAANRGYLQSKYNLGFMYFNGEGTSINYKEAMRWFNAAAEEGSAAAQHMLGYIYVTGTGAKKNGKLAEKWFLAAAKQGNVMSQQSLATFYSDGLLVPKNPEEAIKWLHRARDANLYGQVWTDVSN